MTTSAYGREMKMEVLVGTFIFVVFVGLFYFTIILSRETWFAPKYAMQIKFPSVMGLREEDNVVVRGMPVGQVKTLELQKDGVLVTLSLTQPIRLKKDYRISVVTTSILGGRNLDIHEGIEGADLDLRRVELRGLKPNDLMADAAEAMGEIKKALTTGGVVSNFESIVAQTKEIVTRVNNGEGTLGKLASSDDQLYKDLSSAVASIKNLTAGIEKGEGLIGKLTKDDGLYNDVRSAIDEVRATIDDYRETAPIVSFTSIFFGAF